MLAIDPSMVRIDRLRSNSELSSADGVSGDPHRATAELGRIGVALIVSRTVEAIKKAVDFHAPDGQPVRVLFVLLSPSVRKHLQVFARLAFALHDETLKKLLLSAAPREAILDRIRVIEEGSTPAKVAQPADGGRPAATRTR
jgi:hypothetical protein